MNGLGKYHILRSAWLAANREKIRLERTKEYRDGCLADMARWADKPSAVAQIQAQLDSDIAALGTQEDVDAACLAATIMAEKAGSEYRTYLVEAGKWASLAREFP